MVLQQLWSEHDDVMTEQLEADARVAGYKVVFKCAERALSSKQSRLNAESKLEPTPNFIRRNPHVK